MRVLAVVAILLVSACATEQPGMQGKGSKNGAPVTFNRLGSHTSLDLRSEAQCNNKQINWCVEKRGELSCKCVYVHDANHRVRSLADQMRRQSVGNP